MHIVEIMSALAQKLIMRSVCGSQFSLPWGQFHICSRELCHCWFSGHATTLFP